MVSRLETPGFCASGSKRISRPVSVTAERIFLAIDLGVLEQLDRRRLGLDDDLLIFAVGSCRSWILAVALRM